MAGKRYNEAEKQALLAELSEPGATVRGVAERHGVSVNTLFVWRREREPAGRPNGNGHGVDALGTGAAEKRPRGRQAELEAEVVRLRGRVADLERLLGRKLVELELAKERR